MSAQEKSNRSTLIDQREIIMAKIVPFDTLAYAKKLESGGIHSRQAEAQAEALASVLDGNFVTRNDFNSNFERLFEKMDTSRQEMFDKMDGSRQELIDKMGASRQELLDKMGVSRQELLDKIDSSSQTMLDKIDALRKEMDNKIDVSRKELQIEIYQSKIDMIRWVMALFIGQFVAQSALVFTVIKFLH